MTRFASEWLALREPADAAARAADLLEPLRARRPRTIRDLGCGTGSMWRWLSPRLPRPQHWTLTDRDPDLLAAAARTGARTELHDFTHLTAADLANTDLVTGSAVLDILTEQDVEAVVDACAGAGCTVLFTLSVIGRVHLTPPTPVDADLMAAFNAHQRRGGLLGPDGIEVAAKALTHKGYEVRRAPSPWHLEPGPLLDAWLTGWLAAACEWRPDLAEPARERLRAKVSHAEIAHEDLLAHPAAAEPHRNHYPVGRNTTMRGC